MPQTEGTRARKTLEKLRAQVAVDDRASWAGPMPTLSAADDERLEKALDAALEKYRPRGLGRTQKASGGSVNSESSRRSAAPLRRIGNRRCSSTNLLHLLKRRNQRILAIAGAFASLMLVSGVALAAGGAMGANIRWRRPRNSGGVGRWERAARWTGGYAGWNHRARHRLHC